MKTIIYENGYKIDVTEEEYEVLVSMHRRRK